MLELMWKSKAKRAKENQKGFTLVELIVVVAIIGILAAIGLARMGGFGDSAKAKRVQSEHRMLVGAIQMWQSQQDDVNSFPTWTQLNEYIDGGTKALYEGDTNATKTTAAGDDGHYISGSGAGDAGKNGKLVSAYDKANKSDQEWTYPK